MFNWYTLVYEITGIQEHRIIHDEKIRYKTIGRSTFVTTSA